jgi:hypothetical protein
MPDRMPERMSEYMLESMSEKRSEHICHVLPYILPDGMQKLCQNIVPGWGSLEESTFWENLHHDLCKTLWKDVPHLQELVHPKDGR